MVSPLETTFFLDQKQKVLKKNVLQPQKVIGKNVLCIQKVVGKNVKPKNSCTFVGK